MKKGEVVLPKDDRKTPVLPSQKEKSRKKEIEHAKVTFAYVSQNVFRKRLEDVSKEFGFGQKKIE